MRAKRLISTYLIKAIIPYFLFAWLLLSVILFVQQASRFSDIFFSANIPTSLVWQIAFALVPNVIAFTCPMAILVGCIIGLSRMQTDNELTAIRAAGVGTVEIIFPVLLLGILLSVFAFFINLKGVPFASRVVRNVAVQNAIYKLESPIEPGIFNSEIAGFTIYVKDGNMAEGNWKDIFVFNENPTTGETRLITSSSGRVDSTNDRSELVLDNAVSSTISGEPGEEKIVSESIKELRYAIKTKRGELIEKLSSPDVNPEEMGLGDLAVYMAQKEGKERTEAQILLQRRLLMSVTPLIFCLLGTALVLRFGRKGRGFAIAVALFSLIAYYLLSFLGEQLARTSTIPVIFGGMIPAVVSAVAIVLLYLAGNIDYLSRITEWVGQRLSSLRESLPNRKSSNLFAKVSAGLRDFDLLLNLSSYYLLCLGFLTAIFLIFTAFELWRFAGTIDGGILLLTKYLFYLLPFIYLQLAPSAAMIATLATYVIKSRQNEIITWTSAGQSVYRLLAPCMIAMMLLGIANWQIQERILPTANQTQDQLRQLIRNRGVLDKAPTKSWVAQGNRIFSFNPTAASDNAKQVSGLTIYEFGVDNTRLQTVYRSPEASWEGDRILFSGTSEKIELTQSVGATKIEGGEMAQASNPFLEARQKPSHLNSGETRQQISNSESEVEKRLFSVAYEKKYSTIFLPLIIAMFTAPFALSLSRTGKVVTVGYAVGWWLLFMGVTSTFEQFGLSGSVLPSLAVWSPLMLFAMFGIYLMSRIKT